MTRPGAEAVLITGVYGSGKSSVAEEMATMLERADVPYAAIDLDWLAWANVGEDHGPEGEQLLRANLAAVVANDLVAGMTRFVLAGWYDDPARLNDIRLTVAMPLKVVRLEVPIDEIVRRLAPNPTTGRQEDLAVARRAAEDGSGRDIGDLVVDGDRPVRVVADEILAWLGWLPTG